MLLRCDWCGSGRKGPTSQRFHLLEEHTGIPEVQGRLMAVGLADSVTPPTAARSGCEASYDRLAAARVASCTTG